MKKIFTFLISIFISINVFSDHVDKNEAKLLAEKFYSSFAPASKSSAKADKIFVENYNDKESFYIISFDKGGFVIISADDDAVPILGYSFNSPVDKNYGSNIKYLFDSYKKEIEDIRTLKIKDNNNKKDWELLRASKLKEDIKAVEPLLETIWNQSPYYNEYCPPNTPTGCVATAMSQIMNYHEWPKSGNGWNKYIPIDNPDFGTQYADFTSVTYDWANMPKDLTSSSSTTEVDAVAILNYHAGVAVNMNYDPEGSGALSRDVLFALTSYFKYDPSTIEFVTYDAETESEYFNKLKTEIDNGRPIYYDGHGESGGHAWICDGYDDNNKVHINWGWGGSYNGYFLLSDMAPGSYDFTEGNAMIIGIQPGSAYQKMSWTKQASGFEEESRGVQYISAVSNRIAWAVAFDGSGNSNNVKEYTKTTDGFNWVSGEINATETDGYGTSMISAIDENTAWVALYDPTNGGGKIVKTSDGGQNWTHQSTATFSSPNGFPNVVHFWDENNGWCQGDPNDGYFELYTTTDGGETWTRVPESNIPDNLSGEYGTVGYYDVYGDNIWYATNKGRIFKSTDKGLNWVVYQTPISDASFELSFKNENVGIIQKRGSGDNKVQYITTDGGENWNELNPTGNFYTSSFKYVPDTNLLISTGSDYETPFQGLSYSTDNGKTFYEFEDFYKNFQFLSLGTAGIDAIWAGAFNQDKNNDGMWRYGEKFDTLDFSVNKRKFCLNDSSVIIYDNSLETYDTYEWDFGEGATPSLANGAGPHTIKYTTEGSKKIKLSVSKGGEEDSVIKNDLIYVASGVPEISEISGEIEVNVFDAHTYSVTELDEVEYLWDLPNDWIGYSSNNSVNITFLAPGTESIKVTPTNICGDGISEELEITALCITTTPGSITGDSNVKIGETHTYTVPEQDYISYIWETPADWTGNSSINSIDITFEGEPVTDSIKVTSTSVCGEGESSYLEIEVESSVSISKVDKNIIKIYPNPNTGNFKIDLANLSDQFENLKIEILNTDGSLIKRIEGVRNQNEYDVSIDRKGLFIVRVITNKNQYSLPIIVK
ncbi:MAG: C10 family peptidase [Bacteroidota bacterium]